MEDNVKETSQKLLKSLNELKRLHRHESPIPGMTYNEAIIMFTINRHIKKEENGIMISKLSNILKVASPTITKQINNLEDRGYVTRVPDKDDRRVVRIIFTENGNKVLRKINEDFTRSIEGLVECLGVEDTNKLVEILSKTYNYFMKKNNFK
ncbi:MAG: MarR family transcriptional regulator [Clostridium sp.]|nr:MarR family transcriptional regulator [Clostridium sp.]